MRIDEKELTECISRKLFGFIPIPIRRHEWETVRHEYEQRENGIDLWLIQKCEFCGQERKASYLYSYGKSKVNEHFIIVDVCCFFGKSDAKIRALEILGETAKRFNLKYEDPDLEFENQYCHAGCHYYGTKCLAIAKITR